MQRNGSNSIQTVLLRLHRLNSTVLFLNTVYIAGKRWHRRYLAPSGARRFLFRILSSSTDPGEPSPSPSSSSMSWTEQEARQHLSLTTTGTQKGRTV